MLWLFTYICLINGVNVGKYTIPGDSSRALFYPVVGGHLTIPERAPAELPGILSVLVYWGILPWEPMFPSFLSFWGYFTLFLWLKKPCIKNHGFWGPKVRLARDGITLQKRPVHFQPWPVQGILGPSPGSFAFGCLRPGGVGVGDGCFSSYKWSPYTWPKINGNVGIYDPTYRRGGAQFITSRGPPCIFVQLQYVPLLVTADEAHSVEKGLEGYLYRDPFRLTLPGRLSWTSSNT